ncbi:selenocysteine insertion sequence-binding protein 2-like isoform X2 [Thalassophryne amazonica]|uniref:selenocysteine insertion sequence-binding protein 2-like isoform X2 n=1 Tax=Thalassophryne amazonica TaxID=390379 RepID=UPI001472431C|nr:selenocysteine insertion sequence-binding protein 2-like isoform X2 [Thalassophryne amazonica]
MDKQSKLSSAARASDSNYQMQHRNGPLASHSTCSKCLVLPNPYVSDQVSKRDQSGLRPQQNTSSTNGVPTRGGDVQKSHGHSSSHLANDDLLQRHRSIQDPQKVSKCKNDRTQGRIMGKNFMDTQKRGFRDTRSAPNYEEPKSTQTKTIPFEVKIADFPELALASPFRSSTPVLHKECWGPIPSSLSPKSHKSGSAWKSPVPARTASSTLPSSHKSVTDDDPDSPHISSGQPAVALSQDSSSGPLLMSWTNVVSQPPKKVVPKEKPINSTHMQLVETATQQVGAVSGQKKRKKRKKKPKAGSKDVDTESEELSIHQEPPKFEDEAEFPGLSFSMSDRVKTSSNATKLCNEENKKEAFQHLSDNQNKEKSPALKILPTDTVTKGQKPKKVSGKKSKVPIQLDFRNMLTVLENTQQSKDDKQDAKPVVLSVGGGLPVVQKQPSPQKRLSWKQDKIAHNALDSTSPLVKKGKQREVPKAKKPSPIKKIILKEREERKQRRLLEERGMLPENEFQPENAVGSPVVELEEDQKSIGTDQLVRETDGETDKEEETEEQQSVSDIAYPANQRKIHSRKFRDYCSQMLSKEVDECVTLLLKELVRFQDRLYQKDPMKARMKRRIVMGLREVLKHLKLRKIKCVIISPNCERSQYKGGLDEALHTIMDTCHEQGVPFVFALSRKALGRCVSKCVPVSLVGIFNYDGAQDYYHKMIELTSKARKAYEMMVSSLEQTDHAANATEQQPEPGGGHPA